MNWSVLLLFPLTYLPCSKCTLLFCFCSTTADVDYITFAQNVTFESGEDTAVFSVTIANDEIPEIDESFEVFIKDSPNVNIGEPSVAVGTILDEDLPSKFLK